MTENVENAIFEILKKIQAEASTSRADITLFREDVNARFERLEDLIRKQRRDVAGILVIGKSTAGKFAEGFAALEKLVLLIEAHQD